MFLLRSPDNRERACAAYAGQALALYGELHRGHAATPIVTDLAGRSITLSRLKSLVSQALARRI